MKCGATTKAGTPCRNGLGCRVHAGHCAEKIRARALRAAQVEPVQPELPMLTWAEAKVRINAGYHLQKALNSGDCGCQG
jgi:hypothetical protein